VVPPTVLYRSMRLTVLFVRVAVISHILLQVFTHSPHDLVSGIAASRDGRFVVAAVRNTVVRSWDYGDNWELANRGLPNPSFSDQDQNWLQLSPTFDVEKFLLEGSGPHSLVLCSVAQSNAGGTVALFISRNAASNWREVRSVDGGPILPAVWLPNGGQPLPRIRPFAISAGYADDGAVVMAVRHERFADALLYRTSSVAEPAFVPIRGRPLCDGCSRLALHSATRNGLMLAGSAPSPQLFISVDAGRHWKLAWQASSSAGGVTSIASRVHSDGLTLTILLGLQNGELLLLHCVDL